MPLYSLLRAHEQQEQKAGASDTKGYGVSPADSKATRRRPYGGTSVHRNLLCWLLDPYVEWRMSPFGGTVSPGTKPQVEIFANDSKQLGRLMLNRFSYVKRKRQAEYYESRLTGD